MSLCVAFHSLRLAQAAGSISSKPGGVVHPHEVVVCSTATGVRTSRSRGVFDN